MKRKERNERNQKRIDENKRNKRRKIRTECESEKSKERMLIYSSPI